MKKKSKLVQVSIFLAILVGVLGVSVFFLLRFQAQPETTPVKASDIIGQNPDQLSTNNSDPSTPLPDEEASPTKNVTIYIDAWSLKSLGNETIQLVDSNDEIVKDLSFTPLENSEISELVKTDPLMVTSMLSRLYSPDSRLACSSNGCFIDSVKINTDVLSDLSIVPVFGEIYKANNINTGIYKATISIPESSNSFGLKSSSYPTYFFNLDSRTEEGIDLFTPLDENSTSFYISAGLGRIFPTAPAWSSASRLDQSRWNPRSPEALNEADLDKLATLYASDPFATSISDSSDTVVSASSGLTPYYLTYLTSPVSGCGLSTICSIEPVNVSRSEVFTESGLVCSSTGSRLLAVISSSKWSVDIPTKTHTLGYWGKTPSDPDLFPNNDSYQSVLGYLGDPPLVEGPSEFYNLNLYLIDSNGVVRLEAARSVEKADIPSITLDTIESAFNGEYSPCQ